MAAATAGCGWLPPDKKPAAPPAPAPAPVDPDTATLTRTWMIEEHVMVRGASIDEADAIGFHGRTVVIGARGYVSPWQGTCDVASHVKSSRDRDQLVSELAVEATDGPRIAAFGLAPALIEHRLSCTDRRKPPPLLIYVGGERAMTCFGGACYLLKPF